MEKNTDPTLLLNSGIKERGGVGGGGGVCYGLGGATVVQRSC